MWRTKSSKFLEVACRRPALCRDCTSKAGSGKQAAEGQTAAKPDAQAAPPPPPPPPPPRSGGGGFFFKFLGLSVVGAAGITGYAWFDPEFRKTVESKVPYSKEAFDAIFQAVDPNSRTLPMGSSAPPKAAEPPKKIEEIGLARPIITDGPKPEPKSAKKAPERDLEAERLRRQKEKALQDMKAKEEDEAAQNAAVEKIVSDAAQAASEKANMAMDALKSAAAAIRHHSDQLKKAMEDSDLTQKEVQWESMAGAFDAKNEAIDKAKRLTDQAREYIEKSRAAVKDGRSTSVTKKNPALLEAEEKINQITYDLNSAEAAKEKARSEAKLISEYRDLVKKGREQFKKELESIMPDVQFKKRIGGKMTEDELNSLIGHAHRRIDQLQKQLAEQQTLEQKRLREAIDKQKNEDEILAESKVFREVEKQKAQDRLGKEKMVAEQDVVFERKVRHQLARQAAAHSDHLKEVLKVQEAELNQKYEGILHDRIVAEKDKFRVEIGEFIGRARGIEKAIDARAEAEKLGRKAQELWLACQALVNTVVGGGPTEDSDSTPKPLANELTAIREAGNDHPFVNTVINSIPQEASSNGVSTPDDLLKRFHRVRTICRRVAMVDETGATLFQYLLSFIQSALVGNRSKAFGDDEEIDLSQLNAFLILDNASHAIDRGDLEQAVKYMNQLKGQPRRVAADWIKDARLLLETKQAAEALLSHSAASGLGSLF